MPAEDFRRHLELRHIPAGDFASLKGFHPGANFAHDRPTYAAYHTHLHERYDYDHTHLRPD
jgi:hypothetical protein